MMYYNPFHYPVNPPMTYYPAYTIHFPPPRAYPPVDTKIFEQSIKTFRVLMRQGSMLLDRLSDVGFARKIMNAAQQGKHAEVDSLIKSIGLTIPVGTRFTPSGVAFILTTPATQAQPADCCTLSINMKWGQ
jgi:hypothetical protein